MSGVGVDDFGAPTAALCTTGPRQALFVLLIYGRVPCRYSGAGRLKMSKIATRENTPRPSRLTVLCFGLRWLSQERDNKHTYHGDEQREGSEIIFLNLSHASIVGRGGSRTCSLISDSIRMQKTSF